jgi:hypothetical protein
LNTIRFCTCSPVATAIGAISRRVERRQLAHGRDRLAHVPDLVRVHHQGAGIAERVADQARPAGIRRRVCADLHLHVAETVGERKTDEPIHLLVVVADPAGRGRVRRIAPLAQRALALLAPRRRGAKEVDSLVGGDRVGDVAEVDGRHDLLRRQIGEKPPDRHAACLRPQVPDRIDDRSRRDVHHALLRPEPAELVLRDEAPPESGEVIGDAFERAPDDERLERADRCDADLGPAAVRERQSVTRKLRVVGVEDDVGGRVVGAAMHRVRPVQGA